jgi:hypothetical protein
MSSSSSRSNGMPTVQVSRQVVRRSNWNIRMQHSPFLLYLKSNQQAKREWNRKRFSCHGKLLQEVIAHFVDKGLTRVGTDIEARVAVIQQDKINVTEICKREIGKLMMMAADITKMTYKCKMSGAQRLCEKPADMRKSWCEDGGPQNIKRLLWMFHQLPWQTHQAVTLKEQSHQALVEEMVKSEMNITFAATNEEYDHRKRNCIQQTYTKLLNSRKQDIMKRQGGNNNNIQAFIKCQGGLKLKKNGRSKTQFYWTKTNEEGICEEHKVCAGAVQKYRKCG